MRLARFLLIRIIGMLIALVAVIAASETVLFFAPNGTYQQMVYNHASGIALLLWQSVVAVERDMFMLNFHLPIQVFGNDFLASLMLAVGSIIIAAIIGVPLGILAAVKKRHWFAHLGPLGGLVAQGVPPYTMAVILQLIFAVFWPILPLNGWNSPASAVLPMCALAASNIGYVAKFMQTGMNDALSQDYVMSAKARGLTGTRIVMRHAMRPALMALVTFFGPQTAMVITSTIVVEEIFQVPGLGGLFGYSLSAQGMASFPGMQGGELAVASIFVLAILVMVLNLVVDVTYRAMDPRLSI